MMARFLLVPFLMTVSAGALLAQTPVISWENWFYSPDGGSSAVRSAAEIVRWTRIGLGKPYKVGNEGAWLAANVSIPKTIGGRPTDGKPIGLCINSDCGGAIYVNGKLQARYDNDHAGMALLTGNAKPGEMVVVAVKAFRDIGGDNKEQKLGQAEFMILDPRRLDTPADVVLDARMLEGKLPRPFAGMSQGAGMADYNDDTAARFKEAGVKWFRMDNIFTNAVKRDPDGRLVYDWTDFDRRVDFMEKIGCEFMACASYMPPALEDFPNPDRHSRPKSWDEWEELCYQAAKHSMDRGKRIKYWEVWNESNAGWLMSDKGEDGLAMYLKLYDATWRGVRRADPKAWVGGPCNASGPWDKSPERGYAVNGEKFMRGLLEHCEKTDAPLDFISWHEYFQPPEIFREEADTTRRYMKDYPKAAKQVKEFWITEWNYAWWPDLPQDNEIGACWAANCILRAIIPSKVDKPCFFYAKDGDDNLRGGWGMLYGPNRPKPVYNAMKMFNMMAPTRIKTAFQDPELAVLASVDPATGRITVLVLNYAERFGVERKMNLTLKNIPPSLKGGTFKRWVVDKDHSNAFNNKDRAELEVMRTAAIPSSGKFQAGLTVPTNSITLIEMLPRARGGK